MTNDTRELLSPFEKALRQIGVDYHVLSNMPVGDRRSMNVNEATNLYMQVMEYERGTEENEIGVSKVVERIAGSFRNQ